MSQDLLHTKEILEEFISFLESENHCIIDKCLYSSSLPLMEVDGKSAVTEFLKSKNR